VTIAARRMADRRSDFDDRMCDLERAKVGRKADAAQMLAGGCS
jgi:hypothetical protein